VDDYLPPSRSPRSKKERSSQSSIQASGTALRETTVDGGARLRLLPPGTRSNPAPHGSVLGYCRSHRRGGSKPRQDASSVVLLQSAYSRFPTEPWQLGLWNKLKTYCFGLRRQGAYSQFAGESVAAQPLRLFTTPIVWLRRLKPLPVTSSSRKLRTY